MKPRAGDLAKRATSSALEVKGDLTIGEVARLSGVSATAIRFYEAEGVLAAPPRRHGWRAYPVTAVRALKLLKLARESGIGLKQLATMRDDFAADNAIGMRRGAAAQLKVIEALMRDLRRRRALLQRVTGCDCTSVASCPQLATI